MVRLDQACPFSVYPRTTIRATSRTFRLAFVLVALSASTAFAATELLGGRTDGEGGDPLQMSAVASTETAIGDDPNVRGLVDAQMQEASRFGSRLTDNVRQRLEGLRDADCHAPDIGLRLNLTEVAASGSPNPLIPDSRLDRTVDLRDATPDARKAATCADDSLAAWTGGFFNYGSIETTGADILDFATLGVSGGIDMRLTPLLLLGLAFGYANDDTLVGAGGTRSKGAASSVTAYASYHPVESAFLDGTVEYDRLDFSSIRASEVSPLRELGPEHATGQRGGHQVSGTVTAGYKTRIGPVSLSPSARLSATATRLDAFAETGFGTALGFGRQSARTLISSLALRGSRDLRFRGRKITWSETVEWSHDFSSGSTASFDRRGRAANRRFSFAMDRRNVNLFPVTSGLAMRFGKDTSLSLDHRVVLGGAAKASDHTLRLSFKERF